MPAVTTKFKADDSLDLEAFKHNIKAQIEAGVTGIILGGTLGEASTLTDKEKSILTTTAVAFVENKIPVIINIAAQSNTEAIAAAHQAEKRWR